jgi:hypothetical protein
MHQLRRVWSRDFEQRRKIIVQEVQESHGVHLQVGPLEGFEIMPVLTYAVWHVARSVTSMINFRLCLRICQEQMYGQSITKAAGMNQLPCFDSTVRRGGSEPDKFTLCKGLFTNGVVA